jgi:D-methionine transport system ATP-binding protein
VIQTIELTDICKEYRVGRRTVTALEHVDLHVQPGEIFGIIGYSGAGKSTLLRCINLLERPTQGRVYVGGRELTALSKRQLQEARREIGMIFQHFHLLSSATVAENVAFPLRLAGVSGQAQQARVAELLELVGLAGHADKYPSQLSGGQKQRVAIARALASRPKVLLCDEATSALDPETTRSILDLILTINRELGLTVVVVTHEMAVVRRICDRVAVMDKGRIVESGSVVETFLEPKHPLTRRLLSIDEETGSSGWGAESEMGDVGAQPIHSETGAPAPSAAATSVLGVQGEAIAKAAVSARPGRLMRVAFSGDIVFAPVLSEVAQATGGHFSILRGTIDEVKGVPYGRLLVRWLGDDAVVGQAVAALRQRGCRVDLDSEGVMADE